MSFVQQILGMLKFRVDSVVKVKTSEEKNDVRSIWILFQKKGIIFLQGLQIVFLKTL